MNPPEPGRSVIGFRTAIILYILLAIAALTTLRGTARIIALLIVGLLAAKTYVHHVRRRIE